MKHPRPILVFDNPLLENRYTIIFLDQMNGPYHFGIGMSARPANYYAGEFLAGNQLGHLISLLALPEVCQILVSTVCLQPVYNAVVSSGFDLSLLPVNIREIVSMSDDLSPREKELTEQLQRANLSLQGYQIQVKILQAKIEKYKRHFTEQSRPRPRLSRLVSRLYFHDQLEEKA